MPVTLQDLGWNDHFQRAFNAVAKPGWVPGRLIRETKINFTALLDGGEGRGRGRQRQALA